MGGISNSTLPGTFCFQRNELTHKAHYNFRLRWMCLEKKSQKYTGDMIPITVYTSLKSPCRDICYPFISSVTCKLLQVLLKFFHLLPDRLHLASEISTARINGLFLTRWRAVLGQRTEELCFPAQRWMEIAKKYFWKYTKSAPLNKFVKSENKSTTGHLPLRQSSHCEQPTW